MTKPKTIRLKACPFCGGNAQIHSFDMDFQDGSSVTVYNIGCNTNLCYGERGTGVYYPTKEDAVEAWNTRKDWTSELPDRDTFVKFLKDISQMCWGIGFNADETKQLIDHALESMGEKNDES